MQSQVAAWTGLDQFSALYAMAGVESWWLTDQASRGQRCEHKNGWRIGVCGVAQRANLRQMKAVGTEDRGQR